MICNKSSFSLISVDLLDVLAAWQGIQRGEIQGQETTVTTEQKQHDPNSASHFTQDTNAISVGYTVGGMTIGLQDASTDNANMVENAKDDVRSLSVSVAF